MQEVAQYAKEGGRSALLIGDAAKVSARRSVLERYIGPFVDAVLTSKGLIIDDGSREKLLIEGARALKQIAAQLERNAHGDYTPDPRAARFPKWDDPAPAESQGVSITDVFEGWTREARALGRTEKTVSEYRSVIRGFRAFLGHDSANRVSPDDIIRWKDKRLADGRSAKTVKDSDLSALKSVFGWAEQNRLLSSNPAKGISLKLGKSRQVRPKYFTDEEALAILRAALSYRPSKQEHPKTAAAKRWAPWLLAYTGARVGEVLQLRRQDVRRVGLATLTFTPEAGTTKNKEYREV